MSVKRIASRYAKSLIDLAQENGKLEIIKDDIAGFLQVAKNRDFQMCIQSPIIHTSTKAKVFQTLFEGKVDKATMAFFNIILTKGRESYLPEIASEFIEQYKEIRKISTIKLITASEVDKKFVEAIKSKFQGSVNTRENVEVLHEIDPSLVGGFKVEFDDKLYDASVRHQLDQMKKQFKGNLHVQNI
jgi:F-type H+-transporting ATPase subunit delta